MSADQSNYRPLSQQALYQQKVRLGVFENPSKPMLGVSSNAPDAAALLAASSDLTVHPTYERPRAAPEAHTAALAAKTSKVTVLLRESTDSYAEAAAVSAKVTPAQPTQPDLGVPTYDKTSVYNQAKTNSVISMTARSSPEKSVSKHGLTSKNIPTSLPLNIGKISQMADQNLSTLIGKLFKQEKANLFRINSAKSESAASAAFAFAPASKHDSGYTDAQTAQRKLQTFQASDVVDAALLAAASAKATERLDSINLANSAELRQQAQMYSKALAAAQKRSETRLSSNKASMIDLGGGLSLPAAEVDKLASLIVQPVLENLGQKAEAQREFEAKQKRKRAELVQLHQKAKKEDEERKIAEKAVREKAKKERAAAHEQSKAAEYEKVRQFQAFSRAIAEEKQKELDDLKAMHETERAEHLKIKTDNDARINEKESGLIAGRKAELEKMQAEKDEELKPINKEAEEESAKLKELTTERDRVKAEHDEKQNANNEWAAKVAALKKKLEKTNKVIDQHNSALADIMPKCEALESELRELQGLCEAHLLNDEQAQKELCKEISDLEKLKSELTQSKSTHKKDILSLHQERVADAYRINGELPEHLRETVDENKLLDTGSLFSVEAPVANAASTEPASRDVKRKKSLRSKFSIKLFLPSSRSSSSAGTE